MHFPPLGIVLKALICDLFGPLGIVQNVTGESDGFILAGLELFAAENFGHKIMLAHGGRDYETENSGESFPGLSTEAGGLAFVARSVDGMVSVLLGAFPEVSQ